MDQLSEPNGEELVVRLEIPAKFAFLALVSECLRSVLQTRPAVWADEALSYNIQLAVQEVCTNIIKHAYPLAETTDHRIWLCVRLGQKNISVMIEDTGVQFLLPEKEAVLLPDEPQEHGYGLFLIYSLVERVQHTYLNGRNCWLLEQSLPD